MMTEGEQNHADRELPPDIAARLTRWHGLWYRSTIYHYLFGVVSVGASVISTSMDDGWAKVFSIVAAVATALIGFMHPERRYIKFVSAWRVLDVAAMRYRYGLIDRSALIAAVEKGESMIADFEAKVAGLPNDPPPVAPATAVDAANDPPIVPTDAATSDPPANTGTTPATNKDATP